MRNSSWLVLPKRLRVKWDRSRPAIVASSRFTPGVFSGSVRGRSRTVTLRSFWDSWAKKACCDPDSITIDSRRRLVSFWLR